MAFPHFKLLTFLPPSSLSSLFPPPLSSFLPLPSPPLLFPPSSLPPSPLSSLFPLPLSSCQQLLVWNTSSTTPVQRYTEHSAAVKAIAWSPHQVSAATPNKRRASSHQICYSQTKNAPKTIVMPKTELLR